MTETVAPARRPGRPRSPACDRAIVDAALEEYAAKGFDGLSVDAVAARARVSKATIYRRYPSKLELVICAAYAVAEELAPAPDTGSLRGDVTAGLTNLARLMNDSVLGRVMRMVVGDAARTPDLAAMHREFVRTRRAGMIAALRRAAQRGELRAGVDLEVACDLLSGPMFYRHVVTGMPVDEAFVGEVVDAFVRAYGA